MELTAYLGLKRMREEITYWRTKTGLEVDFIIGHTGNAQIAIEVKISEQVHKQDLGGLVAFCEEHPTVKAFVISQDARMRKMELDNGQFIMIYPWRSFLKALWDGKILEE